MSLLPLVLHLLPYSCFNLPPPVDAPRVAPDAVAEVEGDLSLNLEFLGEGLVILCQRVRETRGPGGLSLEVPERPGQPLELGPLEGGHGLLSLSQGLPHAGTLAPPLESASCPAHRMLGFGG